MERFSYGTLCHYGIRKQRWGERRFQYEDGSLTPEGRIRYGRGRRLREAIAEASTPKLIKENSRDYMKIKSRKDLAKMTDEDLVKAGERIDLEKTLVDKSVALNKSIGEKAVPNYLEKLKEINLASSEIKGIIANVAEISNDTTRALNPILNYKDLYKDLLKPGSQHNTNTSVTQYDQHGNRVSRTDTANITTETPTQPSRVPLRRLYI